MNRSLTRPLVALGGAIMLVLFLAMPLAVGAAPVPKSDIFTANGCNTGNFTCLRNHGIYYPYYGAAYYCGNVNYYACVNGVVPAVNPVYAAPVQVIGGVVGGVVVQTYFDPRYCGDGLVSVVRDPQYGELIDICTSTGQRIYPVGPYYGYPYIVNP